MAGFVAKALCPQLVFLPLDFAKYNAKAEGVRTVLAEYDPRFESASIDEAYLNITEYCEEHEMDAEKVVQQVRKEVHERCKITVSAGIAANAKLAKICSNRNKPNGQFRIPHDRPSIMSFMRDLPVRKVNGVGRVFERELDAVGIKTCGDIYQHRAILTKLFGEKAFQFLIHCYLGLGRTSVAPMEEHERKSVGSERTFGEIQGTAPLRAKLREIADELESDLKRTEYKGRTLVLKVKLHTFEVLTRQTAPPFAVSKSDDLYRFALPMLSKLEKEMPPLRLRLMGLRCTGLVSTAKADVNFFGVRRQNSNPESEPKAKRLVVDAEGWQIWPEAEFEEAARHEREEEMEELEHLSQEHEQQIKELPAHGQVWNSMTQKEPEITPKEQFWDCPVCGRPQPAEDRALNEHVDLCLSRQAIREVVRGASNSDAENIPRQEVKRSSFVPSTRKRGRPRQDSQPQPDRNVRRKAYFAPHN
jgi:DNA polymerase kappa